MTYLLIRVCGSSYPHSSRQKSFAHLFLRPCSTLTFFSRWWRLDSNALPCYPVVRVLLAMSLWRDQFFVVFWRHLVGTISFLGVAILHETQYNNVMFHPPALNEISKVELSFRSSFLFFVTAVPLAFTIQREYKSISFPPKWYTEK